MATKKALFPNLNDPLKRDEFLARMFGGSGGLAGIIGTGAAERVSARKTTMSDAISPIIERRLGPALAQSVAAQAGRPGASVEGVLSGITSSFGAGLEREMEGLQSELRRAEAGVPQASSMGESVLGGALQGGLATGSVVGAIAGGVGGLVGSRSAKKAEKKAKSKIARAQFETTPEAVAGEVRADLPSARSETLAAGVGQQRQQSLEAAISAAGLRDTGLGTLASISGGIQVELAGLEQAFGDALTHTRQQVGEWAGTPARPATDPLASALAGLAGMTAMGAFNPNRVTPDMMGPATPAQRLPDLFPSTTAPLSPAQISGTERIL